MDKKILIVEDDNDINDLISETLTKNGFVCKKTYSGTEALIYLKENFDLFVLDLMLPGLTGEDVIKKIRKVSQAPVLVLSSKDSMDSKLLLLNGGADDYMTKPFNLDEFLARVNILIRRNSDNKISSCLEYKSLRLDINDFSCFINDNELLLTKSEFKILQLLMTKPKQVFTKENIYEYAFGDYYLSTDNSINVHVSNIRKKIKKYTDEEYVETVRGIGFKLHK